MTKTEKAAVARVRAALSTPAAHADTEWLRALRTLLALAEKAGELEDVAEGVLQELDRHTVQGRYRVHHLALARDLLRDALAPRRGRVRR